MEDRRTNEELNMLVGIEPITSVIRSGRLRWYGHVMRTTVGEDVWSLELKAEDRLEDQEGLLCVVGGTLMCVLCLWSQ